METQHHKQTQNVTIIHSEFVGMDDCPSCRAILFAMNALSQGKITEAREILDAYEQLCGNPKPCGMVCFEPGRN